MKTSVKPLTILILILSALASQQAEGRKTVVKHRIEKSSGKKKQSASDEKVASRRLGANEPSIIGSDVDGPVWFQPDSVSFTGYDKTLKSRKESFLIVNHSAGDIKKIGIRITYLDMKDRMLHSRDTNVACFVPSGETRKGDISSWDLQNTYFYYLGPEPRSVATPYKVRFQPLWFEIELED